MYGPLPPGTVGLILGRSSWNLKGLQVQPGVIDSKYMGEIKVICCSPFRIIQMLSSDRVAQLVVLPFIQTGWSQSSQMRGNHGFGSSDAFWIQRVGLERPTLTLRIDGKCFEGLVDTGADVSVISLRQWPTTWPTREAMADLQGIGVAQGPLQSSRALTWSDKEGHTGTFQPFILDHLPINLWGRDVLAQMSLLLYSPRPQVAQMMLNQGHVPGTGLGSEGQGRPFPISPQPHQDRSGLGYHPNLP